MVREPRSARADHDGGRQLMGLSQGPRPGQPGWGLDRARRWRHLVHRYGINLLGGVMITLLTLYAVVLVVVAR